MECQSCSEALTALIDGELSTGESRLIRDHLAGCQVCQNEYSSLLQSLRLVDRLPSLVPEERLWAGIDSRIRAHRALRWWPLSVFDQLPVRRWVPVSALGAVLVLVMAAIFWRPVDPVQLEFSHFIEQREAISRQQRDILYRPDHGYGERETLNPFAAKVSLTDSNPFQE